MLLTMVSSFTGGAAKFYLLASLIFLLENTSLAELLSSSTTAVFFILYCLSALVLTLNFTANGAKSSNRISEVAVVRLLQFVLVRTL